MKSQQQAAPVMRPVDFDDPPVVETVFALVFRPIKSWSLLHYGLLWNRFRHEYPHAEMKLPTGAIQLERLDIALGQDVDLKSLPLRCWFVDQSKSHLVQVQNNAFMRNWRKIESPLQYVHYTEFRPLFLKDWTTFRRFLADEKLPQPEVWQCEVTYINHLLQGREWTAISELKGIFPFWKQPLSTKERFDVNAFSFTAALPDNRGQLQVNATPILRSSDGKQAIQFSISTSGKPTGSSDEQILKWLDVGHEYVVKFFAEFTAPELHRIWRRTR